MTEETEATVTDEVTTETTETTEPSYYLSEGVAGDGDAPEWFKADKYKSVADQAKAYAELSSKYAEKVGSFTGAPDEYQVSVDGIELSADDPLLSDVKEWAKASNLSQDGFNELVSRFAAHQVASEKAAKEAADAEIAKLENSQQRLTDITDYLKANLSEDEFDGLADAITTAKGIEAVEKLIKSTHKSVTAEGEGSTGATTQADVERLMTEKDDSGRVIYRYSKARQEEVRAAIRNMQN